MSVSPSRRRPRGVECLKTVREQHAFRPLTPSFGAVPEALNGRLYQVGPGRFEADDLPYRHWFDGEGLLTAVDFSRGEARAACRLVRPTGVDAPSFVRRGRFGTPPSSAWRRVKALWDPKMYVNPANTALMLWRDRIFALYESDRPTEFDPETLETIGEADFGVIRRAFSAHPKVHKPTGALINQGFRPAPHRLLDYYSLPREGDPTRLFSVPYAGSVMTHDFAVTDRFIVSICPPLFVDVPAIVFAGRPISQGVRWRPERGTEIVATPIDDPAATRRITMAPFLYSHTANAYEDGDDIVIHGVVADDGANFDWVGSVRRGAEELAPSTPGRLTEIRIDAAGGRATRRTLFPQAIDFPSVREDHVGRRHRDVYAAGFRVDGDAYRDLFDVLLRFDVDGETVERFDFGDGHFVSEPAVVTQSDARDRLICVNYDATIDSSYVAIVSWGETPRLEATLPLDQPLPVCFHGLWSPRAL